MAATNEVLVLIQGKDGASAAFRSAGNAAANFEASLRSSSKAGMDFGTAMSAGIGAAIGTAFIDALKTATGAIIDIGREALNAVGSFEMMGLAFNNLIARDLSRGKLVEETRTAVVQLTADEMAEIENLTSKIQKETLQRETLNARIQEQIERIRQMTEVWTDQGLNVETARARLAEMQAQYASSGTEIEEMQARIAELTAKQGQLTEVTELTRVGQMSLTEAREKAIPVVQELLKWTQQVAIQSPYTQEDIGQIYRVISAFGFASNAAMGYVAGAQGIKQAQEEGRVTAERMAQAVIDLSSGMGMSADVASRVAYNLGQIRTLGKVTFREIRDLANAGVPVLELLATKFGTTEAEIVKMLEDGLLPADEALSAIVETIEQDFGGAAARTTFTISGLVASLEDIKRIGLREFFTSTFEAIKPLVGEFVNAVTLDPEKTFAPLRKLGELIGTVVGNAIQKILDMIRGFREGGLTGLIEAMGLSPEATASIKTAADTIISIVNFVIDNIEAFKGAIMGIGTLITVTTTLGAISSALTALTNPISLVITAAGLLGAAWNTNFLGIRDTLTAFWENTGRPIFDKMVAFLEANLPVAIETLTNLWENTFLPAIQTVLDFVNATAIPVFNDLITTLQNRLPEAIQTTKGILSEIDFSTLVTPETFNSIAEAIRSWSESPEVAAQMQAAGERVGSAVAKGVATAVLGIGGMILDTIKGEIDEDSGEGLALSFINSIMNVASAISEATSNLAVGFVQGFVSGVGETLGIDLQQVVTNVLSSLGVADAEEWGRRIAEGLRTGFEEALKTATSMLNPVAFVREQASAIGGAVEQGRRLGSELWPGIQESAEGAKNSVLSFSQSLLGLVPPPVFNPESPTPFELGLWGIRNAMVAVGSQSAMLMSQLSQMNLLGSVFGVQGNEGEGISETIAFQANQIMQALGAAIPEAVLSTNLGVTIMDSIAAGINANEDGKRSLARSVARGMLAYLSDEMSGVGAEMIDFLVTAVSQRLGVMGGAEVRP